MFKYRSISKSAILFFIFIAVGIVALSVFLVYKLGGFDQWIDKSETEYATYEDFRKDAGSFFPDSLPEGSKNMKYQCGAVKENYIAALSFDTENSIKMRNDYETVFEEYKDNHTVISDVDLDKAFLENEGLDEYLADFFENDQDQYKILNYATQTGSQTKYQTGMFYNRDKNRIIMFDFMISID